MRVSFTRVLLSRDIENVCELADIIWTEYYTPIIGLEQVQYMLGNIHSKKCISSEVFDVNTHYYLISYQDEVVGYVGVKIMKDVLFLSKLYILVSKRNLGLGTQTILFISKLAQSNELKTVTLTVNKNNSDAILAYKKNGFKVIGEVCADIGGGYVMDDYQMELTLEY